MLVLMTCTLLVAAPITAIGGVILALREDVGLSSLILLVSIPLLLISVGSGRSPAWCPQFRLMQERIDVVNQVLREQITGMRVVRAFVREPDEAERFEQHQRQPHRDLAQGGPADGVHVPDRDRDPQPVDVGGAVDRRQPDQRRLADARRADRLPQLPHADPDRRDDGHVHGDHGAPRRRVRRADPGGARHAVVGAPAECRHRGATRGVARAPRRRLHATPGAEAPVLSHISFRVDCRADHAIIGSTGSGKTTLLNLVPACSTPPSGGARRRRRRPRARPRRCCAGASASSRRSRTSSRAPWPATCATASPTPPTRRSGRRSRWPRRRDFVRGHARRLEAASPRAAPTCRAVSASASPSPGPSCASRRSTCSTTRSRRSTCAPTPGCAPPSCRTRPGRTSSWSSPAGVHHLRRRPDPRARGRPDRRPRHPRRSARELSHLREIVASQVGQQEAAA